MSKENVIASKEILLGARATLRMTQEDLAGAAGLTARTVANFEGGKTHSETTRAAIQTALERRGVVFTNGDRPGFYLDRQRAIIP